MRLVRDDDDVMLMEAQDPTDRLAGGWKLEPLAAK